MNEEDRNEESTKLQLIGMVFVTLGCCFLLFIAVAAVAHYGFGAVVHEKGRSGIPSEGRIAPVFAGFAIAGAVMLFAGRWMRRAAARMLDGE